MPQYRFTFERTQELILEVSAESEELAAEEATQRAQISKDWDDVSGPDIVDSELLDDEDEEEEDE